MADIAVTPAQVAPIDPGCAEIVAAVPDAALAPGDVVHMKSTGRHAKSAATAAGTTKRAGVAPERDDARPRTRREVTGPLLAGGGRAG